MNLSLAWYFIYHIQTLNSTVMKALQLINAKKALMQELDKALARINYLKAHANSTLSTRALQHEELNKRWLMLKLSLLEA